MIDCMSVTMTRCGTNTSLIANHITQILDLCHSDVDLFVTGFRKNDPNRTLEASRKWF